MSSSSVGIALWSVPGKNLFGNPSGSTSQYNGPGADSPAFTLNGETVTYGEVRDSYDTLIGGDKAQEPKNIAAITEAHEAAQQQLILHKLTEQALKSFKISVDDDYLRSIANDYALLFMEDARNQAKQAYLKQSQSAKPGDKTKSEDELLQDGLVNFMQANGATDVTKVTPENFMTWFVDDFMMADPPQGQHEKLAKNGMTCRLGEEMMKSFPVNPLTDEFMRKLVSQQVRGRFIFVAAKTPTPQGLQEAENSANAAYNKVLKGPEEFRADRDDEFFRLHRARRRRSAMGE